MSVALNNHPTTMNFGGQEDLHHNGMESSSIVRPQKNPRSVYITDDGQLLTVNFTASELQLNRNVPARRRRRTYELDRKFHCFVKDCPRKYASQSALYAHMRIKHMFVRQGKNGTASVSTQAEQVQNGVSTTKTSTTVSNGTKSEPNHNQNNSRQPPAAANADPSISSSTSLQHHDHSPLNDNSTSRGAASNDFVTRPNALNIDNNSSDTKNIEPPRKNRVESLLQRRTSPNPPWMIQSSSSHQSHLMQSSIDISSVNRNKNNFNENERFKNGRDNLTLSSGGASSFSRGPGNVNRRYRKGTASSSIDLYDPNYLHGLSSTPQQQQRLFNFSSSAADVIYPPQTGQHPNMFMMQQGPYVQYPSSSSSSTFVNHTTSDGGLRTSMGNNAGSSLGQHAHLDGRSRVADAADAIIGGFSFSRTKPN